MFSSDHNDEQLVLPDILLSEVDIDFTLLLTSLRATSNCGVLSSGSFGPWLPHALQVLTTLLVRITGGRGDHIVLRNRMW